MAFIIDKHQIITWGDSGVRVGAGLPPLLEIRENWKAFFFQSGKSQGIWHFFEKSGNFDDPIFFLYFNETLLTAY